MWILRALAGSLLWLLAGILGLVGVICCATIILLPVGIPVLGLARKLFGYSLVMFLPRKVRHPAQELGKAARNKGSDAVDSVKDTDVDVSPARKRVGKLFTAGLSFLEAQRKRIA